MKLALWLDANGLSDAEFARRISKTHTTVLRLKRGEIRPSLETVEAIRAATNGEVTADDFMAPFEVAPASPIALAAIGDPVPESPV